MGWGRRNRSDHRSAGARLSSRFADRNRTPVGVERDGRTLPDNALHRSGPAVGDQLNGGSEIVACLTTAGASLQFEPRLPRQFEIDVSGA